jgi:hypothetical protein
LIERIFHKNSNIGEINAKDLKRGDEIKTKDGKVRVISKHNEGEFKYYKDPKTGDDIIEKTGTGTETIKSENGSEYDLEPGKHKLNDILKNEKKYPDKGGYKWFKDPNSHPGYELPPGMRIKKPSEDHPKG